MGKKSGLVIMLLISFFSYSQDEEAEAYNYCLGCIDQLTVLERQNSNLKAQVIQRGFMLDNRIISIQSKDFIIQRSSDYIKQLLSKKHTFKNIPKWQKVIVKILIALGLAGGVFLGSSI